MIDDDEPDSEFDDDWPDDADDFLTVACPHCGGEIYEDAPRCPLCGEYIMRGSGRVWDGKPIWYVILGLLGIVAVIYALLRL